jgi:ribose transport system substrate-binding protein
MNSLRDQYLIKSIVSASEVLRSFESQGQALRLKQIIERTGFTKPKTYRLLYTLERCGFVERTADRLYRATVRPRAPRKFKIGYAWPGEDYRFARDVIVSVQRAAESAGIDLVLADNCYNAKSALRNADMLIREGVDLAMEFQSDERIAPVISAKYHEAGIPLIAIEIPHPGATFYGANNYEAGLVGGRYLARWAKRHWPDPVEEVILMDLPKAGSLPGARMTGMLSGMKELLRYLDDVPVVHLDGDGKFGNSFEAVRKHLRRRKFTRTLIGAINDPSGLGALLALEEAGRSDQCAVVGQNASPEARAELRKPRSSFLGSVGYFPERFGDDLIPLAIDILNKKHVPPALFIKHKMIDASNVNHFYPNDVLC